MLFGLIVWLSSHGSVNFVFCGRKLFVGDGGGGPSMPSSRPFSAPQRQPLFEVGEVEINQCMHATATWHVGAVNVAGAEEHYSYLVAKDHNEETQCASSSSSAA